jgi:hypothetical protein
MSERRGVDVVGLVLGLGALLASAYMITDGAFWPESLDLRWVLAGGAMVIGLGLLVSSLVRKRS